MDIKTVQSQMWKAIAIICVVAGHMGVIYQGGAIGVSIFLTLSGYGIAKSCKKNGMAEFWKKRIVAVWIPYVIWTLVLMAVYYLFQNPVLSKMNTLDIGLTIMGMHPFPVLDPTMWYIPFIFLCYFNFYVSYKIKKTKISIPLLMVLNILGGGGYDSYRDASCNILCFLLSCRSYCC